ncbi:MAG: nitrile hydratase subunit beta [Gammaproteobacteria bacterium]|jgi:nitrile hydratase
MDGIHDLGGKQGFGPVDVDDDGSPFHHDWEGREWGIAQCARTPGITIDWWRHCRELIMPEDYLDRPYFDSWAQTDFATYIEAGWLTIAEIDAGKSLTGDSPADLPPALDLDQVLDEDRAHAFRFDAEIEAMPDYSVGQQIRAAKHGHAGHTRLPQYVRGKLGVIHAYHGAHVFPDLSARGEEVHQPLYSVMFEAAELWPEAAGSKDKVYLDLWESYLMEPRA